MTTLPSRQKQVRLRVPYSRKTKGRVALRSPRKIWSGRRVSNSRPQPWQGCALPTELLPHFYCKPVYSTSPHCAPPEGESTESGAGEESRTLDLNLGKVALYQLSYSRISTSRTAWPAIFLPVKKEADVASF